MDISNNRDNTSLTGRLSLDRQWDIKLDFNHLDQSGAKLRVRRVGGVSGCACRRAYSGEKISILPMPQNDRTDTVNASLNCVGDQGHATIAYFGSFFRDNLNGVQFETYSGDGASLVTANVWALRPSNDLHQFNLTGGYAFTAEDETGRRSVVLAQYPECRLWL